jgi:hypothetical protein
MIGVRTANANEWTSAKLVSAPAPSGILGKRFALPAVDCPMHRVSEAAV